MKTKGTNRMNDPKDPYKNRYIWDIDYRGSLNTFTYRRVLENSIKMLYDRIALLEEKVWAKKEDLK